MASISLDEIKKNQPDPEDFSQEDIEELKKNWDELDDSQKDFYKTYAPEEEEEDEPEDSEDEEEEEEKETSPLTHKQIEDTIASSFKKNIEKYMKDRDPDKPPTDQEKKWFGKDFNPKGWNEFSEAFYSKMTERLRQEAEQRRSEQQEKIDKANEKITAELDELALTEDDVPERGTKERIEFERDFTKFAVDYGVTGSIPKAFELYKTFKGKSKKIVSSKQKKTQRKIAKGGSGGGGNTKSKDYNEEVRDKSMDDILADAVKKWDQLE